MFEQEGTDPFDSCSRQGIQTEYHDLIGGRRRGESISRQRELDIVNESEPVLVVGKHLSLLDVPQGHFALLSGASQLVVVRERDRKDRSVVCESVQELAAHGVPDTDLTIARSTRQDPIVALVPRGPFDGMYLFPVT